MAFTQTRANNNEEDPARYKSGGKRHLEKEGGWIPGSDETATAARKTPVTPPKKARTAVVTEATVMPAANPKKARMAVLTTTEMLIDDALIDVDNNTALSGTRMTSAQFQRCVEFLMEQEKEKGSHAFVGFHVHEECVDNVVLASQSEVKPSYASLFRRGTTSAPPGKGIRSSGFCTK